MSLALSSPRFWAEIVKLYGLVQTDGSLHYIAPDQKFKMLPLVRNTTTTFTSFLKSDARAKGCKVIINGNQYSFSLGGYVAAVLGHIDDPDQTEIEGQVVEGGKVIAGDSRPLSFWFGQMRFPRKDAWAWTYSAGQGDPPAGAATLAAIGGLGPMIVGSLPYGRENAYKMGAAPTVSEPTTGEPPPEARPYMIQRSNKMFASANSKVPETGKTLVAYCSAKRTLLIIVQQHGASPGTTFAAIATTLAKQGFDSAVFMDGSDSATLMVDGALVIAPGARKDETIDVGVGFSA